MWNDILGHEQVKDFLSSYLERSNRPHALLFCGAEGIGKKKLAFEFARSLLCFNHSQGDGCEACRLMNLDDGNFSHPDFLRIQREEDPKTHRLKDISIDQMRELISKSAFAPVMSANKVCIIEDIDRMGEAAANSFLKLLEEPPSGWVFILIASSTDRLLSTILSRVVLLRFHGLSASLTEKFLRDYTYTDTKGNNQRIPSDLVPVLARLSEGSIGLALKYYESQVFDYREQAYTFLEAMPLQSPMRFLVGRVWIEKYERHEALLFVQLLQLLLRDMLTIKLKLSTELYNCDLTTNLEDVTSQWQIKQIRAALNVVNETYIALVTNVGIKLAMEAMALKIDKICKE